jgi:FKBP-type peptidyl-prolyl cis-trans isomerase FklB
MKFLVAFSCTLVMLTGSLYAQDKKKAPPKPKTAQERASYGIGLNIGKNLKQQGLDVDPLLLVRGIRDALQGNKPVLSDKELNEAFAAIQKEVRRKQKVLRRKEAAQRIAADPVLNAVLKNNTKEGDAFLAANGKKKGVKTTKSGLQYLVLKSGKGDMPKDADTVKTHYHGTLVDGTVFDSSVERKQPASFGVGQVIAGWTEALQLMRVGDKWRLFVPAELAYDLTPRPGGKIGPGAVLVFEVELLDIIK